MIRHLALIPPIFALCACDPGVNVLNVTPIVTAIGPVSMEGDQAKIFFWVRDYEQDAVDATLEVVQGGTAREIAVQGGHGTFGLTTDREAAGEPHFVFWTPDVALTEPITLRITVVDDHGAVSAPVEVDLTLQGGLEDPVLIP